MAYSLQGYLTVIFTKGSIMKQTFLFILCLLISAQTLFAQSLEQNLQEFVRELVSDVKNLEQNPKLLADIQDILRPHSDFLFNTLLEIQTDPEFRPYIEKYEALKGQYMGDGGPMPINPNIKVVLTADSFPREIGYDESINGTGVCFYQADLIIIDRGFWEYYRDNDEIRKAILFHELGHCDLKQGHGHNDIMNMTWMDDVLTGETIDWYPLYEEFFRIYRRDETIVCSEENKHLYEEWCNSYEKARTICDEQENSTICYKWREFFLQGLEIIPQFRILLQGN